MHRFINNNSGSLGVFFIVLMYDLSNLKTYKQDSALVNAKKFQKKHRRSDKNVAVVAAILIRNMN